MNLPGFTAENSLYSVETGYRLTNPRTELAVGGTVVPQFFICHGNYCCDEFGNCFYKGHVLA